MTRPPIGVVTVVHGRHEHLAAQQRSLGWGLRPDVRVVVAMGDPAVGSLVPGATLVRLDADPGALPLAAARNAGAREAADLGAERLVFLDVDCVVGRQTLAAYADAPSDGQTVWSGPVTYLPRHTDADDPDRLDRLDRPHPARPDPGPGAFLAEERWELFWSLSFALDVATWDRVGGFDEAYTGYGAEDTDFGQRAARAGCRLVWSGSARAYHQWHPSGSPPVRHLHDVVRNANLFHDRWGWWPMSTWLEGLQGLGLADRLGDRWVVCA